MTMTLNKLRSLQGNKTISDLFTLVFVNFISSGLGFITTIAIANTLGRETFGHYIYAVSIGVYGQVIVRIGADRVLVREIVQFPEEKGNIVLASIILRSVVFLVTAIFAFIFFYSDFEQIWVMAPTFIIVLAHTLKGFELQGVYDGINRISVHAKMNIIERSIFFILIWFGMILLPEHFDLMWVCCSLIFSICIYLISQFLVIFKYIQITFTLSVFPEALKIFKKSIWIWVAAIIALSFGTLNKIILGNTEGAKELGGYAAANQIAAVAMLFMAQIARIGNPKMAAATKSDTTYEDRKKFISKYGVFMITASTIVCLPILVFPTQIMELLFVNEYMTSPWLVRAFCIYIIMHSLGIVASQYIICARLEFLYFASVFAGGILGALLCKLLIPAYGNIGAILALIFSHGFSMALYVIIMLLHVRGVYKNENFSYC